MLMWADHVQLQITANMYNATTHLLVANGNGNVHTFHPDTRLEKFALQDVKLKDDLWLIYINNNHYDALVAEDSPCVTMHKEIVQEEEDETDEEEDSTETSEKSDEADNEDVEIVKAAVKSIPLLGKWIAGPPKLAPHKPEHQAFQQPVLEVSKGSEIETESDAKLKKEIKDHNMTKKSLKSLNEEYTKCKAELHNIQEDKERLKIKVKDLESVQQLTNVMINESTERKRKVVILKCTICEYPFKSQTALNIHAENHNKKHDEKEVDQNCGICKEQFSANDEFRRHIKIKHTKHFNCDQCDFQGSSKIILIKHKNLKHRTEHDQEEGTFRCTECAAQFSSNWNMNNHIRDEHSKTRPCQFFREGRCRFPENECWNKHEKEVQKKSPNATEKGNGFPCFDCEQSFKSRYVMMEHRSKQHKEKMKMCKNAENCTFTKCWFRHSTNATKSKPNEVDTNQEWLDEELDNEIEHLENENKELNNESEDFQEDPTEPNPPL